MASFRYFTLLNFIVPVLLYTLKTHAFLPGSFFSQEPKSRSFLPSGSEKDTLTEALAQVFVSKTHPNQAHASALTVFRSLESKPSCYRTAAASLVLDCHSLEGKDIPDGGLKIAYAARLAVCELEATGVKFPVECKDLQRSGSKLQEKALRCVKRLEERPQWWTSLSNNIQSTVVMCSAVRHEVEKDELLNLHRNITKTQQSLVAALDSSLNEAWGGLASQKAFASTWRRVLEDTLQELSQTKGEVTDVLRDVELQARRALMAVFEEATAVNKENGRAAKELGKYISQSRYDIVGLEEHLKRVWKETEEITTQISDQQHAVIGRNLDLVQRANVVLSTEMASSVGGLLTAVDSLSSMIQDAMATLRQFEATSETYSSLFTALSASYQELLQTHHTIAASLIEQEGSQKRIFNSLERELNGANSTWTSMLQTMTRINLGLDETDLRIRNLGSGRDWWSMAIFFLGFMIITGTRGFKVILGLIGAVAFGVVIFGTAMSLRSHYKILRLFGIIPETEVLGLSIFSIDAWDITKDPMTSLRKVILLDAFFIMVFGGFLVFFRRQRNQNRVKNLNERFSFDTGRKNLRI